MNDERISAEVLAGRPVHITRGGRRYPVMVIDQWQEPGEGRRYRLRVAGERGIEAIAEIAECGPAWRLRGWWP